MIVTTKSENPHTRAKSHPYTAATIKASGAGRSEAEQLRRNEEMTFISLVVQALNPKIKLSRVNEALRGLLGPDERFEEESHY